MKLTVLADNNTYIDQYFLGEPAICYLLEDGDDQLLFDLGYSDVYLKNAQAMGLDLANVHTLVFSHGHNDHTGGLAYLPSELFGSRIVGHPNLLEPKKGGGLSISAPISTEDLLGSFQLQLSREPQKLSEHIWFLGEIPRHFPFENQKAVGMRYVRGHWEPDYVLDDSLTKEGYAGYFASSTTKNTITPREISGRFLSGGAGSAAWRRTRPA